MIEITITTEWPSYPVPYLGKETMWLDHGVEDGVPWATCINARWGVMNGYAMVPTQHPLHGNGDFWYWHAEVHGGVTYTQDGPEGSWWVGFDCNHLFDAPNPSWLSERIKAYNEKYPSLYLNSPGKVFRTPEYARTEAMALARQLADQTKQGMSR